MMALTQDLTNDGFYHTQLQIVFQFLKQGAFTASMVTDATAIPQKNICRYKRQLQQAGLLWEVYRSTCRKTGRKAWYITTDSSKALNTVKQLKFFEYGAGI